MSIGARALAIDTSRQPLRLTAGISSHLLRVFHRKLCARKSGLRASAMDDRWNYHLPSVTPSTARWTALR
jgi:hypothetical protein